MELLAKLVFYIFGLPRRELIERYVSGTNGDREMMASLMLANFEVFDVTMSDLQAGKITLDAFRGLVFPGGFSYAGILLKIKKLKVFDYINSNHS